LVETKPTDQITKQSQTDQAFLIRGNERGIPAWHCILVPYKNARHLKDQKTGTTIDCKSFGSIIEYRDDRNETKPLSGWGQSPPQALKTWVAEHYGTSG
jgi:hypothetical protein